MCEIVRQANSESESDLQIQGDKKTRRKKRDIDERKGVETGRDGEEESERQ